MEEGKDAREDRIVEIHDALGGERHLMRPEMHLVVRERDVRVLRVRLHIHGALIVDLRAVEEDGVCRAEGVGVARLRLC
jgi:hypothetical protein